MIRQLARFWFDSIPPLAYVIGPLGVLLLWWARFNWYHNWLEILGI